MNPKKPIYLITDGGKLRQEGNLLAVIEQALIGANGKIGFVQLREQVGDNPATNEELIILASELKDLCKKFDANLIINRNYEVAKAVKADGVHLGADTISAERVEIMKNDNLLVGYSAHSVEEAKTAESKGVDYLFLSPIFKSISKQDYNEELGLEPLAELCLSTTLPVFALGGINPENIEQCLVIGVFGVACIGSIMHANDPGSAIKSFLKGL